MTEIHLEQDAEVEVTLPGSLTIEVEQPAPPVFEVEVPTTAPDHLLVPVAGPPGPPSSNAGQPRFTGDGPPSAIIGAQPGDEYLDRQTGDIYKLI